MSHQILTKSCKLNIFSKETMLWKLLTESNTPVIFLDSSMKIVCANEVAHKKFSIQSSISLCFLTLTHQYQINNNYCWAADIKPHFKDKIDAKLPKQEYTEGMIIDWKIEQFPGLFENDFKLGLVATKVKEKPRVEPFSQSVLETVNSLITNIQNFPQLNMFLYSLIQALPGKAHVKKAEDLTYMMANLATINLVGMRNTEELIGLDDYQLAKHMNSYWPAKLAQEIQDLDNTVLSTNSPIIGKEETPYLNAKGELVIHSLTKIPIMDQNKYPLGILTLALDTAHLKNIKSLREIYHKLYNDAKTAHYQFMKHIGMLNLHQDQNNLITIREFDCLLLLVKGKTAKEVARELSISPRTIEDYIESIKVKLSSLTRSEALAKFSSIISLHPVTNEL
jgi:DNA-binding CsgD family transcriptional regulator